MIINFAQQRMQKLHCKKARKEKRIPFSVQMPYVCTYIQALRSVLIRAGQYQYGLSFKTGRNIYTSAGKYSACPTAPQPVKQRIFLPTSGKSKLSSLTWRFTVGINAIREEYTLSFFFFKIPVDVFIWGSYPVKTYQSYPRQTAELDMQSFSDLELTHRAAGLALLWISRTHACYRVYRDSVVK